MNQNNIIFYKNTKKGLFILITIILTLGLSISFQSLIASWANPGANPPSNNQEMPIYSISSVSQVIDKSGGTGGGLSVMGNFGVLEDSYLMGKVGIGTTIPGASLEVNGKIYQSGLGGSTFVGYEVGKNDDLTDNYNTSVGYQSLYTNTTGTNNSILGYQAGYTNNGHNNTFLGYNAGLNNTYANINTFVGSSAGEDNTGGSENTFIGSEAGKSNKANSRSTAVGYSALYFADNRTLGRPTYNTAIGYQALYGSGFISSNTGQFNTALGDSAGRSNSSGGSNTFIGNNAGFKNSVAWSNVFVGKSAGYNTVAQGNNTYIGTNAGFYSTGTGNVFIGYSAGRDEAGDNKLYIDNSNTATPLIGGDFSANIVTIGGTLFANTYTGGSCDVAERYVVAPEEKGELSPGDILVLDKTRKLNVKKSNEPYDAMVIGVFSTDPLITMGNFEGSNDKDNPPVALLGRVPTKVTTENGSIEIGDLIVSSSKPGYGMKCDDYSKCQGAIVGKALEDLEKGEGLIEVLINVGM